MLNSMQLVYGARQSVSGNWTVGLWDQVVSLWYRSVILLDGQLVFVTGWSVSGARLGWMVSVWGQAVDIRNQTVSL